jgi:cytoskeletal protein RodZ
MYHMARLRRLLMEWRRWTWRLAVTAPVVLLGALIAGFASTGAAQAQNPATSPTPCPSPTSLVSGVTGTVCQTVQSVTNQTSNVTGTVSNTVNSVTGGSGAATGSAGSTATGGSAAAGSQAQRSASNAQRHAQRAGTTSPVTAVGAPLPAGGLSPLGLPGWLFQPGIGALPPPSAAPVQLNLPEIHPAAQSAQAVKPAGRAPDRLWLVIVFGAVGLVGGAGGHFLGWPGLRRRDRGTA